VRRLASMLLAALALAGCGASMHTSTSGDTVPAEAQIKSAYEKFFSSNTSLPGRVALLQNGPQFKSVIQSFASNPFAKNLSATVSSVTLEPGNKAKVVYKVNLSGASLGKQTGFAVLQNGTWKVGYASLCKLIALGGTTPPACNSLKG
jgi:hypothetical protein